MLVSQAPKNVSGATDVDSISVIRSCVYSMETISSDSDHDLDYDPIRKQGAHGNGVIETEGFTVIVA